jgi:predicted  nucleic acid-binding Zn-ribbon protein
VPVAQKSAARQKGKATGGKGEKKKKKAVAAAAAARNPQAVETEISEAEGHLAALSQQMSLPEVARDPGRLMSLNQEYTQTEERLRALYSEWERVAAEATNA